jgi:hypothetical protein
MGAPLTPEIVIEPLPGVITILLQSGSCGKLPDEKRARHREKNRDLIIIAD